MVISLGTEDEIAAGHRASLARCRSRMCRRESYPWRWLETQSIATPARSGHRRLQGSTYKKMFARKNMSLAAVAGSRS